MHRIVRNSRLVAQQKKERLCLQEKKILVEARVILCSGLVIDVAVNVAVAATSVTGYDWLVC